MRSECCVLERRTNATSTFLREQRIPSLTRAQEKKSVKKQGESFRLCVQMLLNIHKKISANYIYWLAESPRCN